MRVSSKKRPIRNTRNTHGPDPCCVYSCAGPSIFQSYCSTKHCLCKNGCVTSLPSDISVGSPLCALHVVHLLPIHPYEQFAPFIQPLVALLSLGDNGLEPSLAIHFLLLHKSSIEPRPLRSLLTFYAFPCLPVPPDSSPLLFDREKRSPSTSASQIPPSEKNTRNSNLQVRGYDSGLIKPFIVSQYARTRAARRREPVPCTGQD